MGKVKWDSGLSADTFDSAERSQFTPYMGPTVPNGVYCWKVKQMRLGKSSGGHKQLILGLELTPRRSRPDEAKYKGYYITDFQVITEGRAGFIALLLDALGVTGRDLIERTNTKGEPNAKGSREVASIGKWVNNGKQYVMAALGDGENQKGEARREIKGFYPIPETPTTAADEDADEYDEDDTDADEYDEEEEDNEAEEETDEEENPPPPVKKAAAKKAAPAKKAAKKAVPRAEAEDDSDDEPPF